MAGFYRSDIDGLRAIAVLPVVLYHAGAPFFSGGFVGVDVFFVISGYLITRIIAREIAAGEFSLLGFYERRARRILPALLFMTAIVFLACWVVLLPHRLEQTALSVFFTLVFSSNVWFWMETGDYFAAGSDFFPFLHTWSLAIEEQFYLFFPPLLWVLYRWFSRRAVPAIIAAAVGLSFLLAAVGAYRFGPETFYLLPTRAWELGIGSLLALCPPPVERLSRGVREGLALAGLAMIAVAVFGYDAQTPFPGLAAALPCLGAALIIAARSGNEPLLVSSGLSVRPMVFVGQISYSLYLWHWPVLALYRNYTVDIQIPPGHAAALVALSFAAAIISWRYVETPFRQRIFARRLREIFAVSAAGLAGLGASAFATIMVSGAPWRLSSESAAAYSARGDIHPATLYCLNRMPVDGLCHFGAAYSDDAMVAEDPSSISGEYLLWGDSHATAVLPAVHHLASSNGLNGFVAAYQACAPLVGVQRLDKWNRSRCEDFNAQVLAFLEERDDISLVILAARWPLLVEGSRWGGETGEPARLALVPGQDPAGLASMGNADAFELGLGNTIDRIRATGREVLIMGGIPEIGWNVPERWANHYRFDQPAPPAIPVAVVEERQADANAILARLAGREGVSVLPIVPALCSEGCPTRSDGRLLYHDDDHLTRFGAEEVLQPLIVQALSE